jgi:lysyl-tRNA synthetase, class II
VDAHVMRDRVFRLERHPLGLRLHLAGLRIHEWHLGAAVLAAVAVGAALGRLHVTLDAVLAAAAGVWLVAKDWHDLVPSRRDTAAWTLGLHRRPHALRTLRRADPLPKLAAIGAVGVALVNLVSTVTPNVGWRGHALLEFEPLAAMRLSHAIAVPAAAALLVAALYLARRRRRALYLATSLLVALAVLNVLKGLDVEEALGDLAAAALLWAGRSSFYVEHEPLTRRGAARAIAAVTGGMLAVAGMSVWIAAPAHTAFATIARTTGDLLLWQSAPLTFHDEVGRLGLALGLLSAGTLAAAAAFAFRPLRGPRRLPDPATRAAAARLVRAHGSDTLAYFKLRRDKQYLFSDDGRAFIGYRIVNRVLLVSGDPVGAEDAIPSLLRTVTDYAERRGLTVAALGVSARLRPVFAQLGLRSLYVGDEALVDTTSFSLEGRPIRKVRQSVSRLEKAGYRAEIRTLADIDEETLRALQRVSAEWRAGSAERGFSMALEDVRRDEHGDSVIAIARDADGRVRGFLQFVPSYGRRAMSLSFMRRERGTPNGLVEFLVVRSIELLRERDIAEVSLNFAAFARIIQAPRNVGERMAARLLALADRFFQVESLYRFNAKFFPRWEPRYFLFDGYAGLPRAALAGLRAEGQVPAFLLPRQPRSTREPPTIASRPSSNRTSPLPFPS